MSPIDGAAAKKLSDYFDWDLGKVQALFGDQPGLKREAVAANVEDLIQKAADWLPRSCPGE